MDRGTWQVTAHGVAESDTTKWLTHTHTQFKSFLKIFLIWTIVKVFIEFVNTVVSVLCFSLSVSGMWDLRSLAGDWTHTLCVGRLKSQPLDRQGGPCVHCLVWGGVPSTASWSSGPPHKAVIFGLSTLNADVVSRHPGEVSGEAGETRRNCPPFPQQKYTWKRKDTEKKSEGKNYCTRGNQHP